MINTFEKPILPKLKLNIRKNETFSQKTMQNNDFRNTRNSLMKNIVQPVKYKNRLPEVLTDRTRQEFKLQTRDAFFEYQQHKYNHVE